MQPKAFVIRAVQSRQKGSETWPRLLAPFGYYGAKQRLAARLITKLPPHAAWVEVFCGSAALTLAKSPARIEIINDIDKEVVNFFRQLRTNSTELRRMLRLTPYARQELVDARLPKSGLSRVERARRFFVNAMMAMNGSAGESVGGFSFSNSYSRRSMEARVSRWHSMPNYLEIVAQRLSQVRIENKDALELLADFLHRPATLVYLDPPYLGKRQRGYHHDECTEAYHLKMLEAANRAKCMIFISGYDNPLYRKHLTHKKGWKKRRILTATRGHNGKDSHRVEVVWCNKHFVKALSSGRIPIRLTSEERKQNKINPKRT